MADEAEKPAEATGTAEAVGSSESGFRNRRLHNYPLIKASRELSACSSSLSAADQKMPFSRRVGSVFT